ncbi:tyrosine-type recombinase/integrase [Zavarzinella formosa]|uniref:tyrosine-type recombinase/integrase n=1 Tax=Zavarzinella formosa TaxID=360055 RepID=UPI0002FD0520|nr:tyrosine-type recombinase/integrase [Zavarzinella formosa]
MASLQKKGDSFYCQFLHLGKRHTFTVGVVSPEEAEAKARQVEYLLMRLKQRLTTLPHGCDIVTYVQQDGKPSEAIPTLPEARRQVVTLGHLRDRYLAAIGNGAVEANTLYTINIHFAHLTTALADGLPVGEIDRDKLQGYVNGRAKKVGTATIRKELATLRAAWNWGEGSKLTQGRFPNADIRFPKTNEKPPFMTLEEIGRRIKAGEKAAEMYECLYLLLPETEDVLATIKANATHAFVHPLAVFAAHTGARRSEIIRVKVEDVDFAGKSVVIHEKKRSKAKRTHRRVPLTPTLEAVLREWLAIHPGGPWLFCHAGEVARSKKRSKTTGHQSEGKRKSSLKGRMSTVCKRGAVAAAPLSPKESYDHMKRALRGTKWEVLRGLHIFRHSFCSNLAMKGVDQRMIDEFVGHQSPEQVKRYRHLAPSSKAEALKTVFG